MYLLICDLHITGRRGKNWGRREAGKEEEEVEEEEEEVD